MRRIRCIRLLTASEAPPALLARAVLTRLCARPLCEVFVRWGASKARAEASARVVLGVWTEVLGPAIEREDLGGAPPEERFAAELGWTPSETHDRIGALMEVAGLECARRALAEARARAAYRSDTFAHLFSECKLALASLMKPDRDGARKPERDKAIVETMWGVLAMANVIVRNSLFYNQPLTKLDPAGVSDQVRLLRGTPPDLVKSILDVVNADVLQSVYDKARGAAERCRMLPWHAESEALVPFTDECMPQPLRAHQCWCGYWVEVGLWQCPFCGEPTRPPAPNVRPTLLWRRGNCVVLRMSELSPTTLASLKAEEPEEAWEALPGATDPSENLAEDQTGELTGEETNAEKHD